MQIRIKSNASKLYWGHINARGFRYCPTIEERSFRDKLALIDGDTVDVETEYLFEDQFNIGPVSPEDKNGLRIMAEFVDEVIDDIRDNTGKCCFCGNNTIGKTCGFCEKCMDLSQLTKDYLLKGFTRIKPIGTKRNRDGLIPLTQEERDFLLPVYVKSQTTGKNSRNAEMLRKKRKALKDDCSKTIKNARMKRDGMLWLMDHNVNIDNCIFYNHTEKFCFGWRTALSQTTIEALKAKLVGFPFAVEFK